MRYFPRNMRFRQPWRSYQARALDVLEERLDDNRFHLVAPPGSGKTVLGLEIMRRLNRPTLLLAPTLTVRDQWIERLTALFLPPGSAPPAWISTNLGEPRFVTAVTYQALHTACVRQDQIAEETAAAAQDEPTPHGSGSVPGEAAAGVIELLRQARIGTLLVDEAHHLKNEWWRALIEVRDGLDEPTVIALTATPPYDVTITEWERYRELCGPVDYEISAPELVARGELCPHQDYIWLSVPTAEEERRIAAFRGNVQDFTTRLLQNTRFAEALQVHPWLTDPGAHLEQIERQRLYVMSMVLFLHQAGLEITERMLYLTGFSRRRLPPLDLAWLETLPDGCLFGETDDFGADEDMLAELRRELQRIGAVERRKVSLRGTSRTDRLLTSSAGKLQSILEIVRLEHDSLGRQPRLLVLADLIGEAELPGSRADLRPLNRLSVVSIFETIRRQAKQDSLLGVLSGSLVIIPRASLALFHSFLADQDLPEEAVRLTPLAHDPAYLRVEGDGPAGQAMVRLITALFTAGGLTVMIGTKSLLGEGWDAPALNALVLASYVGSYVSSNQMRGRAIRVLPGMPDKTANLWHLACLDGGEDPGSDLSLLSRRFKAFMGVSRHGAAIENGLGRMGLSSPPYTSEQIEAFNAEMRREAVDRASLRRRWRDALQMGQEGLRVVELVQVKGRHGPQRLLFTHTARAVAIEGFLLGGNFLIHALRGLAMAGARATANGMLSFLSLSLLAAALLALPNCLRALWLWARHGVSAASLDRVGWAILKALMRAGVIQTGAAQIRMCTERAPSGEILCGVEGVTSYEEKVFLDALQEMFDPIEDPRYLIVPKTIARQNDFLVVPQIIGRHREYVDCFAEAWRRLIGPAKIVYTRNVEGRGILLHARALSLARQSRYQSERIKCWR